MVKVFAKHNGLPGHVSSLMHIASCNPFTIKQFKEIIESPMKELELFSIYTYKIEIGENELADEDEIRLTVIWSEKKSTCTMPKFGPSVYDSNNTVDDDQISADLIKPSSNNWQQMMAPSQPTLLLQQNQNNTSNAHKWSQNSSMEMNELVSFDPSTDQNKLSLSDDLGLSITDDDQDCLNNHIPDFNECTNAEQSLSHLQAFDFEDFLEMYLPTDVIIPSNDQNSSIVDLGNSLQSHVPTTNIAGSVDFQVLQTTTENRISNLMEQMPSTSNVNSSQRRPARKRPNRTNVDEPNRPKRARPQTAQPAQGCVKPETILAIRAGIDLIVKPTLDIIDYQETEIPCISHFDPSKMISFGRNIKKDQRPEYLSNRDPVRQQMRTANDGLQETETVVNQLWHNKTINLKNKKQKPKKNGGRRRIVCIQGDKTGVLEKKQWLPLLTVPSLYKSALVVNGQIGMGIAVVKEYCINDSEVGYYMVGNRVFLKKCNTKYEESVEHDCIIIKDEDVKDGEFTLKTYMVQVSHCLDKIVGPALFKIARSAAQGTNIDFKFGNGIDLPRLAVYFFEKNNQTGEYEPDWETLCLSDYFHQ